jgi:Domain of unknown function (DUF4743)
MHGAALTLVPGLDDLEMRSAAVGRVLTALRTAGELTGWRDELYPVAPAFGAPPALLVERAAAPHLGMRAYGVHVNGYVRDAARGTLKLWVARRSATKQTWPGKLDHIVAGGQVCRMFSLECAAWAESAAAFTLRLTLTRPLTPVRTRWLPAHHTTLTHHTNAPH